MPLFPTPNLHFLQLLRSLKARRGVAQGPEGQCFSLGERLVWDFARFVTRLTVYRYSVKSTPRPRLILRAPRRESCAFGCKHLSDQRPQFRGLERLRQPPVGTRRGARGKIGDG